jgi:hypothetical protein
MASFFKNKISKKIIPLFPAAFALFFPLFALAALEYPFGGLKGTPTPCEYIKQVYIWGLGVAGVLAVTVVAYGGFLYMAGKTDMGKDYITSALLGLLLLFGAWLILNTINPELAQLKCNITPLTKPPSVAPSELTPGATSAGTLLNDQTARQLLKNVNVKSPCAAGQDTGCVDLNIKDTTVDEILSLGSQVGNGNVFVTAGSEGCGTIHSSSGTANHCTGDKFDLRPNATLDKYITDNYKPSGTRSDGATTYTAPDGSVYAREENHWDVLVVAKK